MRKRVVMTLLAAVLITGFVTGCGAAPKEEEVSVEETNEETEAAAKTKEEEEAEAKAKVEEEAAAKEAEANDCYEKGQASLYGIDGTERDLEAAYQNFEKATELGKVEANFYLGILSDWYSYPEQDYAVAIDYYEACGDNPYAELALGFLHYYGQGVEEDTEKAKEMFQSVVDDGCMEGYLGLGDIANMEEDYDAALEYYTKAAEEGTEQLYVANAMNNIGWMYDNGTGVEQDYEKALEWYEKAAELNNTDAMCNIAWSYLSGSGVEGDAEKALEWFEKAAELGNEAAKEVVNKIAEIQEEKMLQ